VAAVVHLLWFVQEWEQEEDTELLIGVYDSEANARAAIERLRDKPGVVDFPQGFQIASREVNKDHGTEGFRVDRSLD